MTMAEGRRRELWQHTAPLLAELMNGPRQRRDKRAWTAAQLNPFEQGAGEPVETVSRQQFVKSLVSMWI